MRLYNRRLMGKTVMVLLVFQSIIGKSQDVTVNIDYAVKRYIGETSLLDRSKFFKIHSNGNDAEHQQLFQHYNATIGRGFWGPFSYAKSQTGEVGKYLEKKDNNEIVREVKTGFIATEHPNSAIRYNIDTDVAAEWAAEYYLNYVEENGRPEYFEPMNEPFVHAGDKVFKEQQEDQEKMRKKMAELFAAVGKKFDETPALSNIKVIGYSSAWPSMELWDFGHWNSRMKMFMDVAGEHMDGLATHLYDGINVTGQETRRSGSNSEAILDLIESYSFIKWGAIKPHAISEYGGIEKGYPAGYSDVKSIQSVKSINHILFNLLEREDRLLLAIPFITGKATWHINEANNYEPYGAVLWRPKNIQPTDNPNKPILSDWVYTARIHFYQLWNEVKGERIFISSNNPDVQVQAFRNDNEIYVALNNLDDANQTVSLNFAKGLAGLQNVRIKTLKIFREDDPIYTDNTTTDAPASIELVAGETAILTYTFKALSEFENTIYSKNYYTTEYLKSIKADSEISFEFQNVDTGTGYASIRLSIGRKHDKSKAPQITVNGNRVNVSSNLKGYDQANRDDFFGMIEIPVTMDFIETENEVIVKFPDSGGRISSVILQVNKYEIPIDNVLAKEDEYSKQVSIYPNPSSDTMYVSFENKFIRTCSLKLIDIGSGKEVLAKKYHLNGNNISVPLKKLPTGAYKMLITTKDFSIARSIIKE